MVNAQAEDNFRSTIDEAGEVSDKFVI